MRVLLFVTGSCEAIIATAIGSFWLFADVISIDVGPTLALLLGSLITSIFGALTSWMAYKRADAANEQSKKNETVIKDANVKTEKDLGLIHTAVNSQSAKMAEKLERTEQQVLELSKLLAASHVMKTAPTETITPVDSAPTKVIVVNPADDPALTKTIK